MRVNLHAHVEHDALPDHLHHVGLGVLEQERRKQYGHVHQGDVVETGKIALGDVLVDGDLDQIGRRELRHRVADQREQRTGHVPLVGTEVRQKATHESRVVGLAEDVFFVERHELVPVADLKVGTTYANGSTRAIRPHADATRAIRRARIRRARMT